MRIGYLYDLQVFPPKGGNHRHVVELVQGFLAAGHSVLVLDDPTLPGVENYKCSPSALRDFIRNIDVLYVRIDARFTRHWTALRECMSQVDEQPIIWEINSPANEVLAYSWLGGKLAASKIKEGFIRYCRRWFHALRQSPGIWLEERYRRHLSKNLAAAVCVSNAVGRYASEELLIADVHVFPNGGPIISESEILRRRQRRERKEFTVLYSGSAIYPWQGLDYLSQVIELAATAAPDITFVLAVNQKVPALAASGNVNILEGMNQEEVRDAICAADVCVALIPEWPWSKYGFHGSPTKLFEYMAFMVPVLTSNHSQMRDIIREDEDGVLTENNAEEILERLLYLKENADHAHGIGRQAWLRIQTEFNWQHNVNETLAVFENALQNVRN